MFKVAAAHHALITTPETIASIPESLLKRSKPKIIKGRKFVALRHSVYNQHVLEKYGLRPPAPIDYQYHWPAPWPPFSHQRVTARLFSTYPRCFCFNGLGSGKTMAALWAADYLMAEGVINQVIIVTPLSTIWSVWADAIFKHFHHRSFSVAHHPNRKKRNEKIVDGSDFILINHDGIKVSESILDMVSGPRTQWIVDEIAEFSNAKTQRYQSLDRLCGSKKNVPLWTLTGSPTPGAPTDIWSQARLINRDLVPPFFSRFREMVMTKVNEYKWVPKKDWEQIVFPMLQPSVRFSTDDCIDLPPITVHKRDVKLSQKQQVVYDDFMKSLVVEMAEGKIVGMNEGVKMLKLAQIASGLVYTDTQNVSILDPKPRVEEVLKILNGLDRSKCIIFSPFRHTLTYITDFLKEKFKVAQVHGGISVRVRRDIFHDFQNGDLEIIVAHPKCMAHGIDLFASSTIIWWSATDFRTYEQANGRIRRSGQTRHQNLFLLQGTDLERKMYKRLEAKEKVQGLLLEILKTEDKHGR